MKRIISAALIMVSLSLLFIFSSCSKADTGIINISGKASILWSFDAVSYSSDSSYASMGNKSMVAFKNINSPTQSIMFSFYLSSLSTGSYTLSSSPPNLIQYLVAGTIDHNSQSGIVNITSNTGTKISGNFNALMLNGLTLSGTFTDVPVR